MVLDGHQFRDVECLAGFKKYPIVELLGSFNGIEDFEELHLLVFTRGHPDILDARKLSLTFMSRPHPWTLRRAERDSLSLRTLLRSDGDIPVSFVPREFGNIVVITIKLKLPFFIFSGQLNFAMWPHGCVHWCHVGTDS